ncbi:TRAP transporter small permease subunit [Rhodovibrionaceae bacterium A322]
MRFLLSLIDRLASLSGGLAIVMLLCLVISMIYEVCARYVFDAPTLWAFDISYMLNGSIFLIGSAFALRADAHVRIDFLSTRLPERAQQLLNGVVYLCVLLPIFAFFSYVSFNKTWRAFERGEVEMVSPWAPLVWPFYAAIFVGLLLLTLQLFAEAVAFLAGHKKPGDNSGELADVTLVDDPLSDAPSHGERR